jgi:hypothetical protein
MTSNPPIPESLRENVVHQHTTDTWSTTVLDLDSPASNLSPRPQNLGMVERLVPALDVMALASPGVSMSSDCLVNADIDNQDIQAAEVNSFEDWSSKDGSCTDALVTRSASISDGPDEDPALQRTFLAISPAKPTVTSVDLKMMAMSAKKRSNDKSLSAKKRSSRSSAQFNFTPVAVSPTSPNPRNRAFDAPSFEVANSISSYLNKQQPLLHPPEVRGHLFGGDGGFFKAVHTRKAQYRNATTQLSGADSSAAQKNMSATLATTSDQTPSFIAPANVEEPTTLTYPLPIPGAALSNHSSSLPPDGMERSSRSQSPKQELIASLITPTPSASLTEIDLKLTKATTAASEKRKKAPLQYYTLQAIAD